MADDDADDDFALVGIRSPRHEGRRLTTPTFMFVVFDVDVVVVAEIIIMQEMSKSKERERASERIQYDRYTKRKSL